MDEQEQNNQIEQKPMVEEKAPQPITSEYSPFKDQGFLIVLFLFVIMVGISISTIFSKKLIDAITLLPYLISFIFWGAYIYFKKGQRFSFLGGFIWSILVFILIFFFSYKIYSDYRFKQSGLSDKVDSLLAEFEELKQEDKIIPVINDSGKIGNVVNQVDNEELKQEDKIIPVINDSGKIGNVVNQVDNLDKTSKTMDDWKIYTNKKFGFEIKYPPQWSVEQAPYFGQAYKDCNFEPGPEETVLCTWEFRHTKHLEFSQHGSTAREPWSVTVSKKRTNFLQEFIENYPAYNLKYEEIIISNSPAFLITGYNNKQRPRVIVIPREDVYWIIDEGGYYDLPFYTDPNIPNVESAFEDFYKSFRFIEKN